MRFLPKKEDKTIINTIRNDMYRGVLKAKSMEHIIESQLRWYGHIKRIREEKITLKVYKVQTKKNKGRDRPRWTQNEEVRQTAEKPGEKMQEVLQMAQTGEDGNKCGK